MNKSTGIQGAFNHAPNLIPLPRRFDALGVLHDMNFPADLYPESTVLFPAITEPLLADTPISRRMAHFQEMFPDMPRHLREAEFYARNFFGREKNALPDEVLGALICHMTGGLNVLFFVEQPGVGKTFETMFQVSQITPDEDGRYYSPTARLYSREAIFATMMMVHWQLDNHVRNFHQNPADYMDKKVSELSGYNYGTHIIWPNCQLSRQIRRDVKCLKAQVGSINNRNVGRQRMLSIAK